jgi:RHS repeat-associated protein
MQMPGRIFKSGNGYKYGFNGKENDSEVKGDANQQDYGFRIYDPRIGKFSGVDPLAKSYPMLTPYQFASNTPIQAIDLDGLEKYHYSLTFSAQGKTKLKLDKVENFTQTETTWTPTWKDWTKTTTTTTKNPYKSFIVHGQAPYSLGVDGDLGDYKGNFTWTFVTEKEMRMAEAKGGTGKEPSWSWYSSDEGTKMAFTIGLFNATDAQMETGAMNGLWRTNNKQVRKWYLAEETKISVRINRKLPLEQQARQAFELRNNVRTKAREMMSDRTAAERLNKEEPNMTWDQMLEKYKKYSGEDLWNKIITSSQKSRQSVNKTLNVKP